MSTPILQLMTGHYTDNVRVNAIAPSWFESNIGDLIHREPGYEERSMRRVPFGRMGKPHELVGAALSTRSPDDARFAGAWTTLRLDGPEIRGWYAWRLGVGPYRSMLAQSRMIGYKTYPVLLGESIYVDIDAKER